MNKEGSTKIVNFMIPGEEILLSWGVPKCHIVKMHYFLKNLLLYSQAWIRQTNYTVMMTKELRVYQNCKFHDPWDRGFSARARPYKSYGKNALLL